LLNIAFINGAAVVVDHFAFGWNYPDDKLEECCFSTIPAKQVIDVDFIVTVKVLELSLVWANCLGSMHLWNVNVKLIFTCFQRKMFALNKQLFLHLCLFRINQV